MPTAHLSDRGLVRVSGAEARTFLDGLVTCELDKVAPDRPRFGALLTPQGKLLFDFLVFEAPQDAGGGFYLDCLRFMAPDLAKRLGFYKLRAKVAVEDLSETLAVVAGWGDAASAGRRDRPRRRRPAPPGARLARDRRGRGCGGFASPPGGEAEWREARAGEGESAAPGHGAYHAHRIALGVPEGGKDFLFNDTFPHEALMDQLNGIDFDKGCYIGQEVVSRMQHRGTARTRIVPVVYEDGFTAEPVRGDGGRAQARQGRHRRRTGAARDDPSRPRRRRARRRRDHPGRRHAGQDREARLHRLPRPGRGRYTGRMSETEAAWPGIPTASAAAGGRAPTRSMSPITTREWGVPECDDRALFEKLILDGFQAGLSWITILRKRENFRRAFAGFDPAEDRALRAPETSRR